MFLKRYDFNGRTTAIRTLAGAPAFVLADSLYLLFYTNDKIMHRKSRTIYYQAKIFIGEIDSFYPGSCVFLFQILRLKTLVFYKTEWFKITNLLLSLYGLMIIKVLDTKLNAYETYTWFKFRIDNIGFYNSINSTVRVSYATIYIYNVCY